jgi:hypothetical protein
MSLTALKTFILASMVLSTNAFAQGQTAHAYPGTKAYCESGEFGAEKILEGLEAANETKFSRSEQLKNEINTDNDLLAIIKEYVESKDRDLKPLIAKSTKELNAMAEVFKDNVNILDKTQMRVKLCEVVKENNCENPNAANASKINLVMTNFASVVTPGKVFGQNINQPKLQDYIDKYNQDTLDIENTLNNINFQCDKAVGEYYTKNSANTTDLVKGRVDALRDLCKLPSVYKNKKASDGFVENFQEPINEMQKKVRELKDIHTGAGNFNKIELFKAYIAKKYMCECKHKLDGGVKATSDSPSPSCFKAEGAGQISVSAYKLTDGVNDVLKKINFSNNLYGIHECSNNEELIRSVTDICKNQIAVDAMTKVCSVSSGERAKVEDNDKKEKNWEALNNDYWIKRDSTAKDGFIKIKKASNWQILGEGLKPVVPNIVPIWLSNYQSKATINMLTQQALAEKQYIHNIDIYNQNPWMYSYPYLFQQNYFPTYSNPFGLNTTAIGTTGTTSTTGYNFSP